MALHFRSVTLEEAVAKGYLLRSSRYFALARALGLRVLLLEVEGDILVGPAPDLVEVARRLARGSRGVAVDLCCGTGATSLAVRRAGCDTVVGVDANLGAARENLWGRGQGIHLVRADYRTWLPRRPVGMVVFDPPRMGRAMAGVVHRWRGMADLMVTWVGAAGDDNETLRSTLSSEALDALALRVWEAEDLVLALTPHGAHRLGQLRTSPWARQRSQPPGT